MQTSLFWDFLLFFVCFCFPKDLAKVQRVFSPRRSPHQFLPVYISSFNLYSHCFVGNIVDTATIYQNLKNIINDPSPPPEHPVGILTSEERDTWAGIRHAISSIPANHESLKMIDSALFAICLDECSPSDPVELTKVMLHGDGANR